MKKSSIETSVGLFVLIGMLCVGYLTIKLGKMDLLGDNYYSVYADFNSATGLKGGANVEMAGVKIGQIEDVVLLPNIKIARVQLKIDNDISLAVDVIASVKTAGLLGDRYLSLTPGGSDEYLAAGDSIEETESALDIEDLISKYVFSSEGE
ncbi:outer membrane lipid asymmetry maintenance protein MlaD [Moritella sp. F3]|uniref:outer membrane lipid asymmetry maintenance protein MlaD n=1 Tax=Moritella sp. F3 TaxID=2718882 RepID=UPI0018E13DAB|nr:outer membrane lipid asymmetry maintenance protein MlaD [Moritella sp. F3]GIC75487.1 outer membrane lipid asymmetry maintenance protein MlaD [Moritella sp. F1]GIC80632.1 outer membrane lipid asymmetry maintenance protein MlaD [Moritella sp. F3]